VVTGEVRKELQVPKPPICCHNIDGQVSVRAGEAFLLGLGFEYPGWTRRWCVLLMDQEVPNPGQTKASSGLLVIRGIELA
jgi:hypothetical protein